MKKNTLVFLFACLPIFSLFAQQITSVTPTHAMQGATIQVSISGQNTYFVQGSSTSWLTQGVNAMLPSITTVPTYTQMNCIYAIPSNAAIGYWDLHVTDAFAGELIRTDAILIDEFVGVDPRAGSVRESIQLGPNPASDHFTLKYSLPNKSMVKIQIRDLKGALVKSLFLGNQAPGAHALTVQTADLQLESKLFLVTLQVDEMIFAIKTAVLN